MKFMRVLHVLAQLPAKTGSGVYFTNVIEGLESFNHEQAAVYGTTPEYNFNILDYNEYICYFNIKNIAFFCKPLSVFLFKI